MKILKGILEESKEYYLNAKDKISKRLEKLPEGSLKRRIIYGQKYYYLQKRNGKKVVHKYLGKKVLDSLLDQIEEKKKLKSELKKIDEALKMLRRTEGRKRGRV